MRATSQIRERYSRRAFACVLSVIALAAAHTSASAAVPGLPSAPKVPAPPALPEVPRLQPPSVQLPAPPSVPQVQVPQVQVPQVQVPQVQVPQVQVPRAPEALPAPALPGAQGGAGTTGRAAPAVPGAAPGTGAGGSTPGYSRGSNGANGTAAAGQDPAARRRDNRRLQRAVRNLQGCLANVTGLDRRVLVLRAGVGGRPAASRESVARRLGVSQRRVVRAERSGLRSLRGAARSGGCESDAPPIVLGQMPWLMPMGATSSGQPLLSMASLAGDTDSEPSAGAVASVSRSSGDDKAGATESPGSTASAGTERKPKRIAASTGDGTELLLPLLLTFVLLALLAAFALVRNRRSPSVAMAASAPAPPEAPVTPAPVAPVPPATPPAQEQPEPEPAPGDDPDPQAEPEPYGEDIVPPAAAGNHRTRNLRLASSAGALIAGGLIRALLRVRRRR
jgi:hypothetical protein